MKLILVLGALLWLLLSWFSNSVGLKAAEVTTNNLLDKNFDAGAWSGTADGRHGSNVIAAEHNTYIQSNDISVKNDANLTEIQLQNGFTTNHQFEYWHWNTYESNVKSTIIITGANGETTTQIRNYVSDSCGSNNCGGYSIGSDTAVVLSNIQTDYDISVRYDFTDSSNATESHYGVDLKEPSLTLTYESQPIELEVKNIIQDLFKDSKIEENLKFKEEIIVKSPMPKMAIITNDPVVEEIKDKKPKIVQTFVEEIYNEEPKKEVKAKPEFVEEVIETKTEPASDIIRQEFTEVTEEVTKKEPKEVAQKETKEEIKKEEKTDVSKEEKAPVKQEAKQETLQAEKEIKTETKTKVLTAKLDSVDVNVKDVSKNLELKNLIKLDAMLKDEMSLDTYTSVAFYKPLNIYSNQDLMEDTRLLYSDNTLDVYIQNDPVVVKQKNLSRIKYEKRKLMLQIQDLKNG